MPSDSLPVSPTSPPLQLPSPPAQPANYSEFSLSGIGNQFLRDQSAGIKDKSIVWDTFLKANMISQVELDLMLRLDKVPLLQLEDALKADTQFIPTILLFLQKIVRVDIVQYLLVKLDFCLAAAASIPGYWAASISDELRDSAYSTMTRCLGKDDDFTQMKAAKIIVDMLLQWGKMSESTLVALLSWAFNHIGSYKTSDSVDVSLQVVDCLLRRQEYRAQIYHYPNAIGTLTEFLHKENITPQIKYHVLIALWLLTFLPEAAEGLQKNYDIIPLLLETARNAVKEKVIRAAILAIRGLLVKAPKENVMPMVGNKVLNLCETFSSRKWTDEDIVEDLEFIKTEMTGHIQKLTTWDEFASEVRSGRLVWSPVHTSDSFWKLNAAKLNEKDHELLRALSKILTTATDPVVLAVACYDVGQYVKYVSHGKRLVQDLGAKQQMMELITHKDPEVRYNALMAVQQYMSNSWEF